MLTSGSQSRGPPGRHKITLRGHEIINRVGNTHSFSGGMLLSITQVLYVFCYFILLLHSLLKANIKSKRCEHTVYYVGSKEVSMVELLTSSDKGP